MKLCVIYNFAQHYRSSVFSLIDNSFDTSWFFGRKMDDVKKMDYSLLAGPVTEVPVIRFGGLNYQVGIPSLIWKDFDTYLLLGETRCISTWMFCLFARCFFRKKRVFFWTHGWYGKETSLERVLKRLFLRLPNGGVFLYGDYAKEMMIRNGFDPKKLYVIHNSLAYEKQVAVRNTMRVLPIFVEHFKNENPNLIFVGRLTSVKKLEMIILAMDLLRKRGEVYNLTLVGEGEKKNELRVLAEEKELEAHIWFYGPCYDEELLGRLIYNSDLCVSPGNVGLTAMHMMVFGTPVITHNSFPHQMPEFEAIIPDQTGDFYEYENVASLSDHISQWFRKNGDKRELIRVACEKEIDEHWTPAYQMKIIKSVLYERN